METQLERDWDDFFQSGFYATGWSWTIDAQRTVEEVDGVIALLNPSPGSHILDWCGGWGRHAIGLAKRGFRVTLLDFAEKHIKMARQAASDAGIELNLLHADFRQTPVTIQADYAVNLFTAGLGYYTEEDDIRALSTLHAALKPGAKFLIDTMNLFWLVKNYIPRGWSQSSDGQIRHLGSRQFDYLTNRNRSEEILLKVDEPERKQFLDHRIYSPSELASVLRRAGFEPVALYGDFKGGEFTFDSRRIVMISERR